MKIAVYAIYKNEPHEVEGFVQSAAAADHILICDTGSDEDKIPFDGDVGTVQAISRECYIRTISINPWRFDRARDAALALLPADIDVCIALDMDERLEPGWREEIERLWVLGETTRMRYLFDWGSGIQFKAEKIHARNGYRWHHPVHEQLRHDLRTPEVWADSDKLLITHHPDPNKSRGQYLDLLKLSVQEDPTCPHNAFYYARELYYHGFYADAHDAAHKYLQMDAATWPHERAYAWRVIADCVKHIPGYEAKVVPAYITAISEAPELREARVELAQWYHDKQDWDACLKYARAALDITEKQLNYTMNPAAWGAWPWDLASIAAHHLGDARGAYDYAATAHILDPTNERIAANVDCFRLALEVADEAICVPLDGKVPQTREVWLNMYDSHVGGAYYTKESADRAAYPYRTACVKVNVTFTEGEGL